MRTEISVPGPIFEETQRLAQELDMSVNEFCVAALSAYMATYQNGDITKKLDEVYAREKATLEPGLVTIQIASIEEQEAGA